MSNTAKTSKGNVLPLMKLKGKDYLLIAHRLLWLNDDHENFTITTDIIQLTETYAVVRASVTIFDKTTGMAIRSATASKRETKADFADFLEKAETGSIGRALAMVGLGTQFAQQDMEEGDRLADAPLAEPPKTKKTEKFVAIPKELVEATQAAVLTDADDMALKTGGTASTDTPKRVSSFRRDKKEVPASAAPAAPTNGASKGGWR